MFNGIIKDIGKIKKIYTIKSNCVIEIYSNTKFKKSEIGSSVSCSGTCLTLEKFNGSISTFYISKETINRTNYKYLQKGDFINLEKSLVFGNRISGHFVQGHIDTTSKVTKIVFIGKSWFINFDLGKKYRKYLISKGSISINGVSLTISKILKKGFQIVVIPHTLKFTNLKYLKLGNFVNVELDVLGKYIKKFINDKK